MIILIIVVMMRKIMKMIMLKILLYCLYRVNLGMYGFIFLVVLFFLRVVMVEEYLG